jgi:hypothetical protein
MSRPLARGGEVDFADLAGGFEIGGERIPLVPASPGSWRVDLAK